MIKRVLAVAVLAGSMVGVALPAMASTLPVQVCVNYDINVNGTGQSGQQCTP